MKERYLKMVRIFFRMLRHKKMRNRAWWRALSKPLADRRLWIPCRDTVAMGLAIGMFFSMILVLPLQMLFAAVLTMRVRANVPFAMAACWISNAFTFVPMGLVQIALGDWLRKTLHIKVPVFENIETTYMDLHFNAASLILGMLVSGLIMALLSFPVVHLFSMWMPHHLPVLKARRVVNEKS
jgi:uncharacterized protein (DUF2062 family)